MPSRRHTLVAVALFGSLLVPVLHATTAVASNANARPDFDNDGFADLVIPDGIAEVSGQAGAGAIHVLYGTPFGPSPIGSQRFTQNTPGMPNASEMNDYFGWAWAAGDFDGDGRDDLAIGAYGEDVGGTVDAGVVDIIYGAPSGLTTARAQEFHQNTPGVPGANETDDSFGGYSMAAGDFDGDGRDDLAINATDESVGGTSRAGAVTVLYGTGAGLSAAGADLFTQSTSGIAGVPEANGSFGNWGLSSGDVNGDGRDDLVVPMPSKAVGGLANAGAFYVLFGTPSGLDGAGSEYWHKGVSGVVGSVTMGENFASGVHAVGDFDDDGFDDVVVPSPNETVNGVSKAGAVHVFLGGAAGLAPAALSRLTQDSAGIAGAPETDDQFGAYSAASGDFDGDGLDDVAISNEREDAGAVTDIGVFYVLYGSRQTLFSALGGLRGVGSRVFTQDSPGVPGAAEVADRFSLQMQQAADFNGDGRDDLAVPASYEDVGAVGEAGAMYVFFGTSSGITGSGSMIFTRDTPGIVGQVKQFEYFGECCW